MKSHRLQALALIVLGAWLFVSPLFLSGYESRSSAAADNAYIIGLLVLSLGAAAFLNARRFEEWVDLALGINHRAGPPHGSVG
ncbi:MAG TPA: SPW repeat protein [Usitatibacter sp.]|nr:SPW repeat protein [Usitatibacter sp.]